MPITFGTNKSILTNGAYQTSSPTVTSHGRSRNRPTSVLMPVSWTADCWHSTIISKDQRLVGAGSDTRHGRTNAPYIQWWRREKRGCGTLAFIGTTMQAFHIDPTNFAYNKNKVTHIHNTEGIIHGPSDVFEQRHRWDVSCSGGLSIGYFYGYKTAGIFQNQTEIDNYKGAKLAGGYPTGWCDLGGYQ